MLRPGVWHHRRTSWYAISNWWRMWSAVESDSLCMMLTEQQSWNWIWWDWVWMATSRSGFETVSIYADRECGGFFQCKNIAYIALPTASLWALSTSSSAMYVMFFTLEKPATLWPHEWTPFHHHSFKPRPTGCHPYRIQSDSISRLLVC